METLTIIFLILAILGILFTIYYGKKNRRLKYINKNLKTALIDCKQRCSNVCKISNVNVHKH